MNAVEDMLMVRDGRAAGMGFGFPRIATSTANGASTLLLSFPGVPGLLHAALESGPLSKSRP